jgi:hypothetical protein
MQEKSDPRGSGSLVETEDNLDQSNIGETAALYKTERDRPLSFYWTVEDEIIRSLPVPTSDDKDERAALNSILTEAVLAADADQWVSYSRSNDFYSGRRRYHGTAYSRRTVIPNIDQLASAGLIDHDRAPPGRRGWQSRFRASPRLLDLWHDVRAEFDRPEVIYLKNDDKDLIDYRDTDRTRRMRREVHELNEYLRAIRFDINAPDARRTTHHVELDGAFYLETPPEIYRVFNRGSWSMGGRAYGWWQGLKKERRAAALINGEPVLEPDFDAMHAAILYARLGQSLNFDPYETGDYPRKEGKLAFVIAINARSHAGAVSAIASKLDCEKEYAAGLYGAVRRRNHDLDDAGAFGSDKGAGLMWEDSEVTLGALNGSARAGIAALPVHDSMLTGARHADQMAGLMRESFESRFEGSIRCRVRVTADLVLHMPSPALLFPSLAFPLLSSALASRPASFGSGSRPLATGEHSENRRPVQLSFMGLLDHPGPTPEHEAIAAAMTYEGGIVPGTVIRFMRDTRRRRGIRQEDMARYCGISRPQLANAERQRFGLGREPAARLRQWITG